MNLIVAAFEDWGIGLKGTQPVVIPDDRRYFRKMTDGATIIVGHTTLLDFPESKPLIGRKNIVLSRNKALSISGATVVTSVEELFGEISGTDPDKVFVVGGEKIYHLLYPYCTRAFVTKLKARPVSDAYFPNLDKLENWILAEPGTLSTFEGIDYSFARYENKSPLKT